MKSEEQYIYDRYFRTFERPGVFMECRSSDSRAESICRSFEESLRWSGLYVTEAAIRASSLKNLIEARSMREVDFMEIETEALALRLIDDMIGAACFPRLICLGGGGADLATISPGLTSIGYASDARQFTFSLWIRTGRQCGNGSIR